MDRVSPQALQDGHVEENTTNTLSDEVVYPRPFDWLGMPDFPLRPL